LAAEVVLPALPGEPLPTLLTGEALEHAATKRIAGRTKPDRDSRNVISPPGKSSSDGIVRAHQRCAQMRISRR
jgi:hypothetical protein